MDLFPSGDHYVLHADLKGVDPDSVDVSVDGGILTVTAQRRAVAEPRALTGGYLRRPLGQDIDGYHITATDHNRVLP